MLLRSALLALAIATLSANMDAGAQTVTDSTVAPDENKMFAKVETEPSFSGGINAWIKFLEKNLDAEVPLRKKAPAGSYTVIIQFLVDKEGKLSDFKALTGHGYGMEEEVIRILKKSPRWEPATQGGTLVKAFRKQPVTFQIEKEKKKKKRDD